MIAFGYIMLVFSLVMLGISIGGLVFTSADSRLQQENERLKRLLTAILEIEGISFEAYREMMQETSRSSQSTCTEACRRQLQHKKGQNK